MRMAFDSTGEISWEIPDGYYENIAQSDVSSFVHLTGRLALAPISIARFGRPVIDTTEAFEEARPQFGDGNIIIASTHRSDWETVLQPAVFERVGLHHARPIAKLEPMFQPRWMRYVMHKLGAYAVDKRPGHSDNLGLQTAASGILQRGGILTYYMEGARMTENPNIVESVKPGGVISATVNDSLVVPTSFAGISKLTEGKGEDKINVARDEPSMFGRQRKLVAAFGDPYRLEQPGFDVDMLLANPRKLDKSQRGEYFDYLREQSEVVRVSMQTVLDRAYELRGSYLEQIA